MFNASCAIYNKLGNINCLYNFGSDNVGNPKYQYTSKRSKRQA